MKKLVILFTLSLAFSTPTLTNATESPKIEQNEEVHSIFGDSRKSITSVLMKGIEYIGIPYKWGGTTLAGLDCSGFVQKVFANSVGVFLPRTALEMSHIGEKINKIEDLNPGDLVFFNTRRFSFSHVGIYIGDNKFIHSPRRGKNVTIENIEKTYWVKRFNGGRRILDS